jgi:hypothetical protein
MVQDMLGAEYQYNIGQSPMLAPSNYFEKERDQFASSFRLPPALGRSDPKAALHDLLGLWIYSPRV